MSQLHAVMVTFRRAEVALHTLELVRRQSLPPDHVWVIDNDPSDAMRAALREMEHVSYIPSARNIGPAGGFAIGMEKVLSVAQDLDRLVLIDDDDPPTSDTVLEELGSLLDRFEPEDRVACVGLVGARFDRRRGLTRRIADTELNGIVEVDFIGSGQLPMFTVRALRECGVHRSALFFGLEDLELGLRLRTAGWRLVIDGSQALAGRKDLGRLGIGPREIGTGLPPWRRYYSSRNIVLISRWYGDHFAGLMAFAHSGLAASVRALVLQRSAGRSWMALRGGCAGLFGRTGRTVTPP